MFRYAYGRILAELNDIDFEGPGINGVPGAKTEIEGRHRWEFAPMAFIDGFQPRLVKMNAPFGDPYAPQGLPALLVINGSFERAELFLPHRSLIMRQDFFGSILADARDRVEGTIVLLSDADAVIRAPRTKRHFQIQPSGEEILAMFPDKAADSITVVAGTNSANILPHYRQFGFNGIICDFAARIRLASRYSHVCATASRANWWAAFLCAAHANVTFFSHLFTEKG